MTKQIPAEIVEKLQVLLSSADHNITEIRRWFRNELKLSKSQGNARFNEIKKSLEFGTETGEKLAISDKNYQFNKLTGDYVFFLKSAGRNVVLHESALQNVISAYSNAFGDERSLEDIGRMLQFPKNYVVELLKLLDFSHDSLPVLPETLVSKSEDEILADLVTQKKFVIKQKFEKQQWQGIINDAEKWRDLQFNKIDPFEKALERYSPRPIEKLPDSLFDSDKGDSYFVCGAFDWQVGSVSQKRYLFKEETWTTEIAKERVKNYVNQVVTDIKNYNLKFKKCVILFGGDLNEGFSGTTVKGTKLQCDTLHDDQFDAIFESLRYFVEQLSLVFGDVEIHAVRGNHEGPTFYPVMKCLESLYKNEKQIKFNIYSARTALVKIGPVMLLLDHGASDLIEAPIPKSGKARESYFQSLFLRDPAELIGVKQKIVVVGDMHHFEQIEYKDMEFFMFGALPTNRFYENHMGLHNRPRQNSLIINENGVKSVLHYYFD